MCGIVVFTGNHKAAPILLDGLAKLEYRGYDSAGLAVRDGETIEFSIETRFCFQKQIARTEFFEKDGFFASN